MEVVLSEVVWNYLEQNVLSSVAQAEQMSVSPVPPAGDDPRASTGRVRSGLSEAQTEQIVDELLSLFCSLGLRPDQEPNDFGLYVESLIDVFHEAAEESERQGWKTAREYRKRTRHTRR